MRATPADPARSSRQKDRVSPGPGVSAQSELTPALNEPTLWAAGDDQGLSSKDHNDHHQATDTMTSRSRRGGSGRRSITRSTAGAEGSIWGTFASYANELAPVAGPLLAAIGQAAEAIDRAEQRNRCIDAECIEE